MRSSLYSSLLSAIFNTEFQFVNYFVVQNIFILLTMCFFIRSLHWREQVHTHRSQLSSHAFLLHVVFSEEAQHKLYCVSVALQHRHSATVDYDTTLDIKHIFILTYAPRLLKPHESLSMKFP